MSPLLIILSVFAVYRLSVMLALEDGPGDAFSTGREWLGQKTWVGRGAHCPACISFWLSLVAGLLLVGPAFSLLWYWLGIAGAVHAIYKITYSRG